MNKTHKTNGPFDRIRIGLGIAMVAALTGCGGYWGGGYGGVAVVPGPDTYLFGGWGGGYERGRDVHVYSQRGSVSRSVAHVGGGGIAHAGGGGIAHAGGGGGRSR
jgi:hypothetical protein